MKLTISICFTLFFLACLGCSGVDKTPLVPEDNAKTPVSDGPVGVGISEYFPDGTPSGGTGLIGLFNVWVDTDQLKGEMVPARESTLQDVLEAVDITNFLMIAPCTSCVKLMTIELDTNSNLVLKIGIKHPFPRGNPLEPPSGKNRADLHLFNVEGIIVSDGGGTPTIFPMIGEKVGAFVLKNADGYTPYLDDSLDSILPTQATIHPYKLHFDDYGLGNFNPLNPMGFLSVTTPGPYGNLVMPMGSNFDIQNYVFSNTGGGNLRFVFAVGCTYGVSAANTHMRFSPEYRIPQHNKKAASEVRIDIVKNDLYAGDLVSNADLEIKVLDISHGVSVGAALDQMLTDSSVRKISIEVPGITASPVVILSPIPAEGNGRDPSNPLTFKAQITNSARGGAGTYIGLVKVLDSYSSGLNTAPLLHGMDGIKHVAPDGNPLSGLFTIPEFATYQTFEIEVIAAVPTCVIKTTPDPPDVVQGETIILDGSSSSCPNPITTYEWDLDYNGITFNADESGAVIEYSSCTPDITPTIALRVTNQKMLSSICTVDVTINPDDGPIDIWGTDENILSDQNYDMVNVSFRGIRAYGEDIYVVVNNTITLPFNIYFIRSEDRGKTWEPAVPVTNLAFPARSEYANMWVDGNTGYIYLTYYSNIGLYGTNYDVYLTRSLDRGSTWQTPIKVNPETPGTTNEARSNVSIDDSVSPSRIYVAYLSAAVSNNLNVFVARTTTDNLSTWITSQIDDSARYSNQAVVCVNPVDYSVNVVWCDPINYGGTGRVFFDRSTNNGATWGTDVTVYTHSGSSPAGPYDTNLTIQPTSGIPGVMWRDINSSAWKHKFSKATTSSGSSWSTPITLGSVTYGGTNGAYAGSIDVTPDGHWVTVFKHALSTEFKCMFTQSLDDGVTWSTPVQIDDASSIWNPNLCFDDCKNVHVIWSDRRSGTYNVNYDRGS